MAMTAPGTLAMKTNPLQTAIPLIVRVSGHRDSVPEKFEPHKLPRGGSVTRFQELLSQSHKVVAMPLDDEGRTMAVSPLGMSPLGRACRSARSNRPAPVRREPSHPCSPHAARRGVRRLQPVPGCHHFGLPDPANARLDTDTELQNLPHRHCKLANPCLAIRMQREIRRKSVPVWRQFLLYPPTNASAC